jgi:hypothetical protein
LLKSKQEGEEIPSVEPFRNLFPKKARASAESSTVPATEVPSLDEFKPDDGLPDPALSKEPPAQPAKKEQTKAPPPPQPSLSELDAIERSQKFQGLSAGEKERLGTLSRQEKMEDEDDGPAFAPVETVAPNKKSPTKKSKKSRAQRSRDEEELNQLMMQN